MGEKAKVWSGKIDGHDNGFATLVLQNGRLIGHVQYGSEVYRITPGDSGLHTISELDISGLPDEDEPLLAPDTNDKSQGSFSTSAFPTRIRVLVMFTPAAESEAVVAGTTIRDEALLALGMANTALANSAMKNRYKWAGVRGLYCGYAAQGSTSTVLQDVTNSGTCVGGRAATKRNEFSADMVATIKGTGGCGVAWYSANGVGAANAFSVTARGCLSQHSFTHELGHNQGLNHARYEASSLGIEQTGYNYGLAHPMVVPGFRTVMAYSSACNAIGLNCPRVPVFTNTHPMGKWNGTTTGRGMHLTDPALARRRLMETWEKMAAFR